MIPKDVLEYCQARPGCKDCTICADKPSDADDKWLEMKIKQVREVISCRKDKQKG